MHNDSDSVGLLSVEIADDLTPSGTAMDGVLQAYRQQGYQAGYHRALNDVLADFLLFTQRLLRTSPPATQDQLHAALHSFELQLETSLTHPSRSPDGFLEGGLGI